jgi:hypothetical protein
LATTVRDGYRVLGLTSAVHSGRGRLLGYLISHSESTAQTVIFYDSLNCEGSVLHQVKLHPNRSPFFVRFGTPPGKEEGIPFSTGLSVNAGNCEVAVWSIGYVG